MPVTQRKRSFQLFRKMKFSSCASTTSASTAAAAAAAAVSSSSACSSSASTGGSASVNNSSNTATASVSSPAIGDEGNHLDIDKMILHVLDCLGALQCVMGQYDASRAKVFWGAVATIAEIGIDQATGHVDRRHPGASHLLRAFPNDLKATDGRGWLPLHWAAVADHVDVDDVRSIARADPLATVKGCNQPISATPGHLIAAVRHPRMEVVRCLYNFYPRMANAKDNDGDLPLHYAARYSESTDMVLFLLQANPSATKVRGEGNLVPLQNALYHEHPYYKNEIVKVLLEADASAASIVNADGDTVFHIAINQECHSNLLQQLLRAFPEGLQIQNDIGHLPIHAACLTKDVPRSVENIELLLQAYPQGVRIPCAYGHLPAHLAAESSNAEVLHRILEQYPEAARYQAQEDHGNTPLMKAVSVGNLETVEYLCRHYPDCITLQNHQGLTAMHFAAELGDQVAILMALSAQNPDCCKIPDSEGRLPLHIFLQTHPELGEEDSLSNEANVLRYLLSLYPESVNVKDRHEETPLSLVLPTDNDFVKRLLLRAHCPEVYRPLLRALNYQPRKWALFVTEAAINADGIPNIFAKLRGVDHYVLKEVFSYL